MKKGPIKRVRIFSPAFKKEKVELIETGKATVSQISRIYEVSKTAVYKWLRKYGKYDSTERLVVEKKSESKKNIELLKKIEELERVIGRQQVQILYKEKIIELGSELIGKDLEKKYDMLPSQDF